MNGSRGECTCVPEKHFCSATMPMSKLKVPANSVYSFAPIAALYFLETGNQSLSLYWASHYPFPAHFPPSSRKGLAKA